MRLIPLACSGLAATLLAACATTPPPPRPAGSAVRPTHVPPVTPPPANWEDRRPTPGDWVYRPEPGGSLALFGQGQAAADLVVGCNRATGQITLSRFGLAAPGVALQMTLRATDASRSYPAHASALLPGYIAVELSATDPQLDAMVHSRGAFLISLPDRAELIVPAWAEFARVVEDCRG